MAPDRAIGRYRRWYRRLLRLYPTPFRERFGEPMAQTFTDLARERADANRGLLGFALATFAETTAGIMRENMTQIMQTRVVVRWLLITAAVLAIPALAMGFSIGVPDPGSGTDGVDWDPMDFAVVGVLVLGTGLLFEYASTRNNTLTYRAAVGIAVAAGLFLIWANLAVGMIGDEGNPANLMYVLVLAVALIGVSVAPLRAAGRVDRHVRDRRRAARRRRDRARSRAQPRAAGGRVLHRGLDRIGPALPPGEPRVRSGDLERSVCWVHGCR